MHETILVVDDNSTNRALAEATLGDEGFHVAIAKTGEEAVAVVSTSMPNDGRDHGPDGLCDRGGLSGASVRRSRS